MERTSNLTRGTGGDFVYSDSMSGFSRPVAQSDVQFVLDDYVNNNIRAANELGQKIPLYEAAIANPTPENLLAAYPTWSMEGVTNPENMATMMNLLNNKLPQFKAEYNRTKNQFGLNPLTINTLNQMPSDGLNNYFIPSIPSRAGFREQADFASARALREQQGGGGIGEFFRGAAPIAALGLGAFAAPAIAGAFAAPAATGVAAGGATAGGLSGLGSSLAGAFNAGTALSGALTGGLGAALSGGDLKDALLGAGLGGLGGGFGSSIAGGLGFTSAPARQAITGALTGASGGLATGDLRSAALGAALGAGGGYLKAGGDVPFLGSMEQQVPEGFIGAPRPSTGIIGGITDATNTGLTIGGQPMRLGSLLSAGGDVYGYMQGRNDIEDIQRMQQQAAQQAQAQLNPYAQAGQAALQNMQAPNMEALMNDPAYQFQLQQGNQAVERSLAARGLGQSGAALKAAQEYGQGLASQTYDDFFNRQAMLANQGLGASQGIGSILGNTANANAAAQMAQINLRNQSLSNILGGFNDEGDYLTGSLGRLLGRFA